MLLAYIIYIFLYTYYSLYGIILNLGLKSKGKMGCKNTVCQQRSKQICSYNIDLVKILLMLGIMYRMNSSYQLNNELPKEIS